MVQTSGWAREPVPFCQWYSSQAELGYLSNCLVCHWVAALHDYLRNSYIKTLSGSSYHRPTLSLILFSLQCSSSITLPSYGIMLHLLVVDGMAEGVCHIRRFEPRTWSSQANELNIDTCHFLASDLHYYDRQELVGSVSG